MRLFRFPPGFGTVTVVDSIGKAGKITGFGNFGGTGIALGNGYLYASADSAVFRYKLNGTAVATRTSPKW